MISKSLIIWSYLSTKPPTTNIKPASNTFIHHQHASEFPCGLASWRYVKANTCLSWGSHGSFGGESTGCSQFFNAHLNNRGRRQKSRHTQLLYHVPSCTTGPTYKDKQAFSLKVNVFIYVVKPCDLLFFFYSH